MENDERGGYSVILAANLSGGIGYQGKLPWKLKYDLIRFRQLTSRARPGTINAVVMGKRTWESLPATLSNRVNVVVGSRVGLEREPPILVPTWRQALEYLRQPGSTFAGLELGEIFVIGGSRLYTETLPKCDTLYLTRVFSDAPCDVQVPEHLLPPIGFVLKEQSAFMEEGGIKYQFTTHVRAKDNSPTS